MSSKEKQVAAIEDSRLPERDSVAYETTHNLEIPNLAVTVSQNIIFYIKNELIYINFVLKKAFAGPFIQIDSTPADITGGRLKKMMAN